MFAILASTTLLAKSVVFTLNDKAGTRVFYKVDSEHEPVMVLNDDGTCTINGAAYEISGIKSFRYSNTDFADEKNTIDGDATTGISTPTISVEGDMLQMAHQGRGIKIYTLDGKLVKTVKSSGLNMSTMPAGNYVITNGISTIKILKR